VPGTLDKVVQPVVGGIALLPVGLSRLNLDDARFLSTKVDIRSDGKICNELCIRWTDQREALARFTYVLAGTEQRWPTYPAAQRHGLVVM
jgi:hypothetical protein